jgi:hypothetical protein
MTTQAEIAERNRKGARRFFWSLLILATATSLCGNIAHAVDGAASAHVVESIVAASIAPVFLMALVHGVAHLARNTASGRAYALVLALVGGVAAFAFAQSYGALAAFAGQAHVLAPSLTPLIVDATIAVSTFALVVLGEKPTKRVASRSAATMPSTSQVRHVSTGATATSSAPRTAPRDRVSPPVAAASARSQSRETATPTDPPRREFGGLDAAEMAVALVESKVTRQPIDVVRAILEAHRDGVVLNRIAKDVNRHHTAVRRIIDAAAAHQQNELQAVG